MGKVGRPVTNKICEGNALKRMQCREYLHLVKDDVDVHHLTLALAWLEENPSRRLPNPHYTRMRAIGKKLARYKIANTYLTKSKVGIIPGVKADWEPPEWLSNPELLPKKPPSKLLPHDPHM